MAANELLKKKLPVKLKKLVAGYQMSQLVISKTGGLTKRQALLRAIMTMPVLRISTLFWYDSTEAEYVTKAGALRF